MHSRPWHMPLAGHGSCDPLPDGALLTPPRAEPSPQCAARPLCRPCQHPRITSTVTKSEEMTAGNRSKLEVTTWGDPGMPLMSRVSGLSPCAVRGTHLRGVEGGSCCVLGRSQEHKGQLRIASSGQAHGLWRASWGLQAHRTLGSRLRRAEQHRGPLGQRLLPPLGRCQGQAERRQCL